MIPSTLHIGHVDGLSWDDAADVVVVGLGAAGACTALEAQSLGAEVLIVDKFEGGGTTALSGGVVYAGATRFQKEAGFDDNVEEMFKYLSTEVGDVVQPDTLRRFCEHSAGNLDWLIQHGATYASRLANPDLAYDAALSSGASLYFSGNECVKKHAAVARPAPRGHITVGPGFGSKGIHLYRALRTALAKAAGVRFQFRSPTRRLIVDSEDRVVGVEVISLDPKGFAFLVHRLAEKLFHKAKGNMYGPPARFLTSLIDWAESQGTIKRIRARRGVVLTTGGFINNREMLKQYLPQHLNAIPMGSAGCRGDGIRLGQSVGAATRMDCGESGRSLLVPKPFKYGLLVNTDGRRFIAEDAYGASIGNEVFHQRDQAAWLILDAHQYKASWKLVMPWRPMIFRYRARALMPLMFAWRRASSLEALAHKCGIDPNGLTSTFRQYNQLIDEGKEDWLGKLNPSRVKLGTGPYFAINCSPYSKGFPPLSLTLSGLLVNEDTGQVRGQSRPVIEGLYAAGRVAIGMPSNFLVSGLSLADCVFSGRRAGQSAATATTRSDSKFND